MINARSIEARQVRRQQHLAALWYPPPARGVQAWPEDLSQLDAIAEFSRIVAAASTP
jgi:hypothetical protein